MRIIRCIFLQKKTKKKRIKNGKKILKKWKENTNKNLKNLRTSEVVGGDLPAQPPNQPDEISLKFNEIFGFPLTPTYLQAIQGYLDKGLTKDMIVLAIEQTGFHGSKNFAYLKGILNNWHNTGIRTVEEAREMIAKHEKNNVIQFNKRKGGKSNGQRNISGDNGKDKKTANEYGKYF